MKKIILPLIILIAAQLSFAQDNFISEYFSQYEQDADFVKVNITQKTFSLLTDIETESVDEQRVIDAMSKINGIKVLHKEKTKEAPTLYREAMDKMLDDERYEELVSAQTTNAGFMMTVREEGDYIIELTMLAGDAEKFFLATLYGELNLKELSRLTKVLKEEGVKWFNIFENIDSDELVFGGANPTPNKSNLNGLNQLGADEINIEVFPNPVGDFVRLQSIDGADTEYELEFFSIIGEPIKNIGTIQLPYKVALEDLPSGAYFLRLTKADGKFKNYRIVKP